MTSLKYLINQFKSIILAIFVVMVYLPYSYLFSLRLIFVTNKKFIKTRASKKPLIFAHYHQDELLLVGVYSYRFLSALSSLSKDGTLMTYVLRLLGYRVYRGSSSRGGAAGFLGLLDAIEKNKDVSLAVDGPRGPIYKVKPGVIELASKSGAIIFPVGVAHGNSFEFKKSWNKCYLVSPFSKNVVLIGLPIFVSKFETRDERSQYMDKLEKKLLRSRKWAQYILNKSNNLYGGIK